MFSLRSFLEAYESDTKEIVIRGRRFRFFVPRTLDRFLDTDDPFYDFPLWSKIWEASLVLADDLAGMAADPGKRILEIGCGLGVVGIVAASFGHRLTMTEYNSDALNFARANADENATDRSGFLEIKKLDWTRPSLEGRFDCVVGSEVIYKETDFDAILKLFKRFLAPDGQVILSEGVRRTSVAFFGRLQASFHIRAQKRVLRSQGEEYRVILCKMRLRDRAAGSGASS
jgi:2-polyprenyl-3-methyl-5-hydroxy-6-metoxy-1,4-benzoquinol methylase